jgi:predicted PurR-regulated permease PerM
VGTQNAVSPERHEAPPERVVSFRPRAILTAAGVLLGLAAAMWVVWMARQVVSWVLISIFLALALNPAIAWLQRHAPLKRRASAAALIYVIALLLLVGLGFLLVPPVVDQASGLADAAPGYIDDLTAGRGPLGFLQTKYHLVDRVREALSGSGGGPGTETVVNVTRGVITVIVALVTILFMTFFMILEGPTWYERLLSLAPDDQQARWRSVGDRIAQTVSGYVTGNLLISLIAGLSASLVLWIMGVPFALALGLVVAILDLIPLAGATIAGIIVVTVAFLTSVTAGIVVAVFVVVYQQIENHFLQPVVYGRTVELSPLVVLISVLIGAKVAGVLGALGAIPIAGTMQILLVDWRQHRAAATAAALLPGPLDDGAAPLRPGKRTDRPRQPG